MEKIRKAPINNQIEPDFLHHIESTFKRWRELEAQGVTIGTRELSNFAFTLKGAVMNSHIGFTYNFNPRAEDEAGNMAITLRIYTNKEQNLPGVDNPAFFFTTFEKATEEEKKSLKDCFNCKVPCNKCGAEE